MQKNAEDIYAEAQQINQDRAMKETKVVNKDERKDRGNESEQYCTTGHSFVTKVAVQSQTQDMIICYKGDRESILVLLRDFQYEKAEVLEFILENFLLLGLW